MRLLLFNLATDADDPILGFTTGWIRALARRVESLRVITMRAGRVDVPANVAVYSVGKEKGYSEPRRVLEFYRHLFRILREDRPDACFSHMIPIFTVLAAPILRARGIPVVTWYAHPSLTVTLKLAHHLSSRMVASLATAYPYSRDKLTVIGQGIDTELFAPDGTNPEHPPMILCAGRLSPVKDHPTLLRAAALLRERGAPPFQLVILGGPAGQQGQAYVRSLHEEVRQLRIGEIVRFEAPVANGELPTWYRRCTVHVNLTPAGFGDKVAWEAMACARPCVLANEGFKETLGKYADRLLYRYQSHEDLVGHLSWLLSQPSAGREVIGEHLRHQVVEHHSLGRLSEKLVRVLAQAKHTP